jgi:RNA polymerase sigma-70 factor (ECF subfamily)
MGPDREAPPPAILSLSDEDLMARVAEDEERAFSELVRRYQGRVTNLVSRVLNDRECADDLAQEVFVRVYVHRRNYPARLEAVDVGVHDRGEPRQE